MLSSKREVSQEPVVAESIPDERRGVQLLTELFPFWRSCSNRLAEVLARQAELIAEVQVLKERIAKTQDSALVLNGGTPKVPDTAPSPTDYSDAVKAVLGELAPPFVPPRAQALTSSPDVIRFREVRDELSAIDAALPLLREQLEKARRKGSKVVCDNIRDEYRAKVAGPVIEALKLLGEAMIQHENFKREFRSVNLTLLAPLPVEEYFGDVKERSSGLRQLLSFGAECGHHDARIPPHWRRAE